MVRLKILITSTRPGRSGPHFAHWIEDLAKARPGLQAEVVDPVDLNLPFMDEPNHPMQRAYQHDHTKNWSRIVDEGDAFVIIAAEYNYGYTAVFKNAVDYLYHEWKNKPVAFVGYGGVAGGSRSIQLMKPVLSMFNMVPLSEAVYLPFARKLIDEAGFHPTEDQVKSAVTMLEAVERWGEALKPLRPPRA